jgi:hypothetical protein
MRTLRGSVQACPTRDECRVARILKALWSHLDDVVITGGFGGYERGWEQNSARLDLALKRHRLHRSQRGTHCDGGR